MNANRERKTDTELYKIFFFPLGYFDHLWSFQFPVIFWCLSHIFLTYFKKYMRKQFSFHLFVWPVKQTWAPLHWQICKGDRAESLGKQTEYLQQVCLSDGDRITLRANGYWDPGFFLNLGLKATNSPILPPDKWLIGLEGQIPWSKVNLPKSPLNP